jgi:hypothetical protein
VGIIAAFGFAIGVAWPRLAGVQLGPSAPADALGAAASAVANVEMPSASVAAPAVASSPAVPSAVASVPAVAVPAPSGLSVRVGAGQLLSCKDEGGEALKGKACGNAPAFDAIARLHLEKLGALPALQKERGKITVVTTLDFKKNKVFATTGKSSTVKDLEPVKSFLETELANVSLGPIAHDYPRYTLQYVVTLSDAKPGDAATPSGDRTPAPRGETPKASGNETTIAWDVAIVRDAPHTGAIVGRLPRGTKVTLLGAPQGGWYHVQWNGSSEGWLYRGALGK